MKIHNNSYPIIHNFRKLPFILVLLLVAFVIVPVAVRGSVNVADKTAIVQTGDEKFDKIFREGRDLIDKEEWAKAAAKFGEIACDCPENKYVDAAIYWLAFCQKKQKQYKEASESLDRLIRNYPASSWADDGRVMQLEIQRFNFTFPASGSFSSTGASAPRASVGRGSSSDAEAALATTFFSVAQKPLEREDEVRLAAFQSLYAADPKRAIEALGNILKSDSKASETLKREIIRSLRSSRRPNYPALLSYEGNSAAAVAESGAAKTPEDFTPVLRETLVRSLQNESNEKIKAELVYAISAIADERSLDVLVKLYSSESSKDTKKAIISSLGGNSFVFESYYAGWGTANISSTGPVSTAKPNSVRKLYFDRLKQIAMSEKDIELRRHAFSVLIRSATWNSEENIADILSAQYDSESDEQIKLTVIRSFANSKQEQATMKLIDIAKNEKSDKVRLEAIRALSSSKNPQAIKFLEDLLK